MRGAEDDGRRDAGLVASSQRDAQTHQRSPGCSPSKPHSGRGVERSLPAARLKARNSSVITAQTVWLPRSSGPVAQQPSRKKPVSGAVEQGRELAADDVDVRIAAGCAHQSVGL